MAQQYILVMFRGHVDIVWSCVSTLFTNLWDVLHLKVFGPHENHKIRFLRKFKWIAISIFSREYVIRIAVHQLYRARKSTSEMRALPRTQFVDQKERILCKHGNVEI